MRKLKLSTGAEVELDGDILAVLEAVYREITLKSQLRASFEDVMQELRGIVEQMTEDERRSYLLESLFLNSVTYENEMLDAYMRRLTSGSARKKARGRASGRA